MKMLDALIAVSGNIAHIAHAADLKPEEMPSLKITFSDPHGFHRFRQMLSTDPGIFSQPDMPPDTWLVAGLLVSLEYIDPRPRLVGYNMKWIGRNREGESEYRYNCVWSDGTFTTEHTLPWGRMAGAVDMDTGKVST